MLLVLMLLVAGCARQDLDSRLDATARPYRFNTAAWEARTVFSQAWIALQSPAATADSTQTVLDYFVAMRRLRIVRLQLAAGSKAPALQSELASLEQQTALELPVVDRTIRQQVRDTLAEQGIFNPVDKYLNLKTTFPPVSFEIAEPPRLLVVSPRDRIAELRTITLRQDLSLAQAEGIEDKVDALNVSSLVVELGGFAGTYPVFVSNQSGLQHTIDTVAHEWLHQYLAFRPLGFAYMLDLTHISPNPDIATINETVASIFGKEMAVLVYAKYYQPYLKVPPSTTENESFNRQMRDIRIAVEQYLKGGDIGRAEAFMNEKRAELEAQGYFIRKLNQAYFAFNGTYADSTASTNPIGSELKTLRSKQKTLKEFIEAVSVMTGPKDLVESVK